MFAIDHAATALIVKRRFPSVHIAPILVAVQAMELAWVALNYLGIERTATEPVVRSVADIHLAYMPYSHSVATGVGAALLAWLVIELGFGRKLLGRAVGLGIVSHLVLDLLTHGHDIVLWPGLQSPKLGLGLYESAPIAAFAQMHTLMSTMNDDPVGACRPFDRDRTGLVFGEAGALMVIETEEHAKARGANILARIMGAGITSDGYHMVAPDPNGERAGHAMSRAIQLAGLSPSDIGHVNAHATGTSAGDVAEAKAIDNALGSNKPAVYAPKAALGHSVGAVGAVESILTVLALRDQVVPPTLNLENLDPEIDLDVVAGKPRPGNYEYAINNSFGFGGHNVAIVFGRY